MTRLVSADSTTVTVEKTKGFVKRGAARMMIKINDEWISYSEATDNTFKVGSRGMRNSREVTHNPGDAVYQGRIFSLVVDIPGIMYE